MAHKISVIIPTFNEAQVLPALLAHLKQIQPEALLEEILVCDGGSTDETVAIAEKAGAKVVHASKGRARQMNAGAQVAVGSILYFLHADTKPPPNAWQLIWDASQQVAAGCFRLKFDTSNQFLQANAWLTRFDINAIRFGDQSLFIHKNAFEALGGFDEQHIILEDQQLIRRLRRRYSFAIIPHAVTTSDRKYRENGYVKLQAIFFVIYLLYRLKVSQHKLLQLYRKWVTNGKH